MSDKNKNDMSNRKIFEILRMCPRERSETTSSAISNAENMLKGYKENGLMNRWTKLLHYYKGPSQASGNDFKNRGKDGVKLVNMPEYRLLSDVSKLLCLDQVQCTHLWRHFGDQRAKHQNSNDLLTCNVLERIMSFHFAERTFLIRSVQELLLKCHERSHPLNEISRKIVRELLSKHKIFDTLIELVSQGFRSSPPWCMDGDVPAEREMQFQLPNDVSKTGMVHLLSTVIRDPKCLQSFWGTSYHVDFVKSESLGSTVYMQAQNGLKRGKILSVDKDDRCAYNIKWEGSQASEKLSANRSGLFALPPVSVDLSSNSGQSRSDSIRVRVPRLNVWKLQCANVEGTMSGSVQDCSTREIQWLKTLRTRWTVLQVEEIEELLKLLCLVCFEPGIFTDDANLFDDIFQRLADFFIVRAGLTLSTNLIQDLSRLELERRRVGWFMMLCLLELILYKSSSSNTMSNNVKQLDSIFTTNCNDYLKSGHRNAHLFVPLMMAWGAFREDGRIERWIFKNSSLWNLLEQTLQCIGLSSPDDDEIVYTKELESEACSTQTTISQISTLSDSDDTSYTLEESRTMMGMKMMELLDTLCRVFPALRRLPQRFHGIFLALKASQTYPFDHRVFDNIAKKSTSSQDGGIFGMISHSIRQFPCHVSPMIRIVTSFVLNAESAYGVIALLGNLDRFTWWCSGLEDGTIIGERLLVDARIKLRKNFGGGDDDDVEGCVYQTLSRSRCQTKRTDVLKQGNAEEFDKAVEFTLDTPYSAWPILMKLVRHTNHMLRFVISDNATTSHRGINMNWKILPNALSYTTETVDILRLLVNMFANARSEDIEILLRSLYPKEHSVDGAMINLVSLLTHLLSRSTYIVSACTKILLSIRNESKSVLSEFARVSYDMILHCISLLDVLLRSSRVGSEAVYNGVLSSGVASALSDMNIFKTLSRIRMYECQYGRYDVTVRYLRLLEHLLRHMRKSVLCLDISRALKELDANGDGSISSQELKEGLVRMGLMISDEALRRLVARFDRDGDGSIDYGELIRFIQKRTSASTGKNKSTMRSSAQIARDRWQSAKTNAFMDTEETDRLVEDELDSFLQQITKRSTMCAERHEELVQGTSEYVIDMMTKVGIWRYQDRVQRWQITRRCMRVLHLLVLCQPLRDASVFAKTQEQSTLSTFGAIIESFAEHPGLRKSLVESTFALATSAFSSKPRTARGQVSFGHERIMHLPVNFDEGMRNSSSSIERKELESMSAEGLKLILALLRLDDATTTHCNWPQSCRASLLLEPKCRWITALASYVNYNVEETEDNSRDLIPVLSVQILHATCDSLAVHPDSIVRGGRTTGTYSDAWLNNGGAHLLSSLEPETSAFRDSLIKHLSNISKTETSVALRVAILQFLSCSLRCHPALATHLLYPIHYERLNKDEEDKKRDTNKEKKSEDDFKTLVLDDGVLEAALKPLLSFQDVIEHLERRPQLVVAALMLCHDLWCSARPRPHSASTPFGRSHVRLVAAIREGRFAQAFWKGVCTPLNTWVGKFLDCTSSSSSNSGSDSINDEDLVKVNLYSGETLKPKIVNVTVNALRDHCYRLDCRTWALRLVTLETFQNETRITMKTNSHVGQFKGDTYFRESQIELRKRRRFYSWITEYTQVQYTPKVARTIEAGSAEAGVELQLLQQQRFGFANSGLREYGPDYVFDTTWLRHQPVFCGELQRANSMWGLMEAQMSLLEAWKANMLLTVSVQYAATTTRAVTAKKEGLDSDKKSRNKIDSPMIRSVSKTRNSFFPLDRTSETMVYTIAKLIEKKPVREGFVQQCAERELWELLLSMLHHQLYDVKRKFADPRLAVTAQRNSTNIDAVDIVKRLQQSALRIMKLGTGPSFAHFRHQNGQQEQQSKNQQYFDPLSVNNPLLQGEINTIGRHDLDPRAAQIEAQCVGQLSTLITTLLVLWRKILGHNGELERVNNVVTVHRRSLESDSKKRELSSAQRKGLYEAEIRIAEIDKIRRAFVNATAEMIGDAESRGGVFERWPGLFPLVSTLLATLLSSDGTQHLMSTRLSQNASRALLMCFRRATSEASRVDSDSLCAKSSDIKYRALRRSLLGRTHLTRRMRSTIALTSGLGLREGRSVSNIGSESELSEDEEIRFHRENMNIATLRRSCGRAESVLLTLTSLVQSTSFGCDSLILDPLPFLRAICADPLLQRLQQQREMVASDSDQDISWGYDTTDGRRYPPHRVWCFSVRWIALLLTNVRHERSDGTEHSKSAAAIIRGCIDFVMSYSSMLLRALRPVDLTVASLQETTQVVALLRALSRHRQTWTFAMPARRQTELLESARLLLRDLSIVIDPRSTDSTLQFRAVSPDERWKEENQRSKKRFQRAFKKISGLSLMKRLKNKLGGTSPKKSGGGMLLRLAAAATKSKEKSEKDDSKEDTAPSFLRLPSTSSVSSTVVGDDDDDLTDETTMFRKSTKLLLLRAIRQLTSLMREVTPEEFGAHPILSFHKANGSTHPPSLGHVAFCIQFCTTRREIMKAAKRDKEEEEEFKLLGALAEEGTGLLVRNIALHLKRYSVTDKEKHAISNLVKELLPEDCVTESDECLAWIVEARDWVLQLLRPSKKKPKSATTPAPKTRAGSALDIAMLN